MLIEVAARRGVWSTVALQDREADGVKQVDGDGNVQMQHLNSDIDHLDQSTPATVHLPSAGSHFQSPIPILQLNKAATSESKNWADMVEMDQAEEATSAAKSDQQKATATIEAVQQQIFQTSALISAEERKLLDAMEGNSVVSRAWTDDQRGYESNEELSTSEEVGSSNNLNATATDFILGRSDRELLDAMLSADPKDILSRDPYSAIRANRSRNDVHRQQQNKPSCVEQQDEPTLVAQGVVLDMPNQRTVSSDTSEVVEGLQQIVKTVPVNATEEQKSHTKENSWGDNVRRPPMRNAKLKQVFQTTSTKSKRSKKKS